MDDQLETLTLPRQDLARSRQGLDRDERLVKDGILRMGSMVEAQIRDAIRSMAERDAELAARVIAEDAHVNDAQREITDTVLMTIATQSPVARDLRFLLALDHVASELERIGDHASGIAKQVRRMIEEPPLREIRDLTKIGNLAADQVRGVVSALIDIDDVLARTVAAKDDDIDHGYRVVFGEIIDLMRVDPTAVERGTRIILAAHWIERIGDRVTNIAEDVVYLATGNVEDLNP
ncbi:MAG TPA: phosphate signaling complex protein PhoU [Candidatus Limnocylindrales bacterium]|jgi:phosphate transport system protein|nr:phosphate signaling complex protein PhoU [Candidatus Limnocylindrales bacterium]